MMVKSDYPIALVRELRLQALERAEAQRSKLEAARLRQRQDEDELREIAATKLRQGASLTRAEVAAFLAVSPKKVQRMGTSGKLRRCPGLGTVVRYAARDVLRLASAS